MTDGPDGGGDDGRDDDPKLRSLRAFWRAMPDEEPPARGLAELLAAAREKAETMAAPTWWRRAVAGMMRPPVLAFATVVLLLGGVFVVTNGGKQGVSSAPTPVESSTGGAPMAASPAAGSGTATGPAGAPGAGAGMVAPSAPGATGASAVGDEGAAEPPPPVALPAAPSPASASAVPSPASVPAKKLRAPARHEVERTVAPAMPSFDHEAHGAAPVSKSSATPPPPARDEVSAVSRGAKGDADDAGGDTETRGPVARPKQAPQAAPDAPTRQQLDDQLLARCRAAAARGDCESAKLLAQRIASSDAAYYRAHVATDTAIAACLAP